MKRNAEHCATNNKEMNSNNNNNNKLVRMQSWVEAREKVKHVISQQRYVVFAHDVFVPLAKKLEDEFPDRFKFYSINYGKFADGTDDILISGFSPKNDIAGEHVLYLASFHNNDVTLSQFSVFIVLLQGFISSLTIVLPFYPVATMERVDVEGRVATANTIALLFSNLPNIGSPTRLMIYDIHTLQNRFYFHNSTIASLHSAIPLLLENITISSSNSSSNSSSSNSSSSNSSSSNSSGKTIIDCVAFPDDGAAKRFGSFFAGIGLEIVICGKVRRGDKRIVHLQDGNPTGKNVLIVDDLVQTGGTLYECGQVLKNEFGAKTISAFVTHPVFPNQSWKPFCKNIQGSRSIFDKFFITNSVPTTTNDIPKDDIFCVLDLLPTIIRDLDRK